MIVAPRRLRFAGRCSEAGGAVVSLCPALKRYGCPLRRSLKLAASPKWRRAESRMGFLVATAVCQAGSLGKSRPVFQPEARVSDGGFQCVVSAEPGTNYTSQASANLIHWTPVATVVVPRSGVIIIKHPYTTNHRRRFYRNHAATLRPRSSSSMDPVT